MNQITLVIPVYNCEKYIRQCLDSATKQSYENYEVLVVNDGSTDGTLDICREYENRYQFLRVLHRNENRGLVYSWKEGVRAASGDYIAFLDSDDWVDEQYLESLASGIPNHADIVCCNYNKVFKTKTILQIERVKPGFYTANQIRGDILPILLNDGAFLCRGVSPHRWGKLFRRQLLLDNLIYTCDQISYGEDLNIFFAAIQDCSNLLILDDQKGLYYYRQNEASIIYAYKAEMFNQIYILRNKLFEIMNSKSLYDFTDQINADFLCLFLEYVKNETKRGDMRNASREVFQNFENSREMVSDRKIKLKPLDVLLMFFLRLRLPGLVYIWMKLYHYVKKN